RVIRGQLVLGDGKEGQVLGTVVLTDTDGEQVDWARPDFDGGFALALPREGRYVIVATARGWAPVAQVADLDGDGRPLIPRPADGGGTDHPRRRAGPPRHGHDVPRLR